MQFSKRTYAALGYAVAGAAALTVTAKPASAQSSVTYNIIFNPNTQSFVYTPPAAGVTGTGSYDNPSVIAQFQQFNPTLGTLTSIQINYGINFSDTYTITRLSNGATSNDTLNQTVNATLQSAPTSLFASASGSLSYNIQGSTTTTSGTFSSSSATDASQTYSVSGYGAYTSQFIGTGNYSTGVSLASSASIKYGTNGTSTPDSQLTTSNTTANFANSTSLAGPTNGLIGTITYNYNPVPATPAQTSALIGMAMCGAQFGMVRLRRRRTSKRNIA